MDTGKNETLENLNNSRTGMAWRLGMVWIRKCGVFSLGWRNELFKYCLNTTRLTQSTISGLVHKEPSINTFLITVVHLFNQFPQSSVCVDIQATKCDSVCHTVAVTAVCSCMNTLDSILSIGCLLLSVLTDCYFIFAGCRDS